LRDSRMGINASGIDRTDTAAGHGRDDQPTILATRRQELDRLACIHIKSGRQFRPENDGVRIISKVIEISVDNLVRQIGCLQMKSWIDPEKIDCRVFKTGARAERAAQHWGTGNDIGKLPAHPHDCAGVVYSLKIAAVCRLYFRVLGRCEHGRTWPKAVTNNHRAVVAESRVY